MRKYHRGNIPTTLNQPLIYFLLHLESPIQNLYNNTSSSHVKDEDNDIEVGMEDIVSNTHAMDVTLLKAFQHNELGDDIIFPIPSSK